MDASAALGAIRTIVAGLVPFDAIEEEHRRQTLKWISETDDIFRRVKPATPSPHLVAYFLLVDPDDGDVLLVEHIRAGLWLPSGGHVEPSEHPVATVLREAREELGIEAEFSPVVGARPLFLTVTETVPAPDQHADVSLWFVLAARRTDTLTPDLSEFRSVRWWTRAEIAAADFAIFDPHLRRMLAKLDGELAVAGG